MNSIIRACIVMALIVMASTVMTDIIIPDFDYREVVVHYGIDRLDVQTARRDVRADLQIKLWPYIVMAYIVMSHIAMAYIVMAYTCCTLWHIQAAPQCPCRPRDKVMVLYSYGINSCVPYSYGPI